MNARTRAAMAAAALLAAVGCGGTATIEGKVTFGGQPVTQGIVRFVASDASMHDAPIQPDGTFAVSGVPVGTVKIAVINPNPDVGPVGGPQPAVDENPDTGRSVGRDVATKGVVVRLPPPLPAGVTASVPVPDKYTDPDASGLERSVTRGSNQIDLPLE